MSSFTNLIRVLQPTLNLPTSQAQMFQLRFDKCIRTWPRDLDDAKFLYEQVEQNRFFKNFLGTSTREINTDGLVYCCSKMKYVKFSEGSVIFKEGEESNGVMYLVYSGDLLVVSSRFGLVHKDSIKTMTHKLGKGPSLEDISFTNMVETFEQQILGDIKSQEIPETGHSSSSSHHHLKPTNKLLDRVKHAHTPSRRRGSFLNVDASQIMHSNSPKRSQFGAKPDNQAEVEEVSIGVKIAKDYGTIVDKIEKEGFFGEKAILGGNVKRGATIIANSDCELFAIDKEEFKIMKTEYDKTKTEYLAFLFDFMPGFEFIASKESRELYVTLLSEQSYSIGSYIVEEGSRSSDFYILFSGKCHVTRKVFTDESAAVDHKLHDFREVYSFLPAKWNEICVCEIERGGFIGDEIIIDPANRVTYSVKVMSDKARVIKFDKRKFCVRSSKYIFAAVLHLVEQKKQKNQELLMKVLETKGISVQSKDLSKTLIGKQKQFDIERFLVKQDEIDKEVITVSTDKQRTEKSRLKQFGKDYFKITETTFENYISPQDRAAQEQKLKLTSNRSLSPRMTPIPPTSPKQSKNRFLNGLISPIQQRPSTSQKSLLKSNSKPPSQQNDINDSKRKIKFAPLLAAKESFRPTSQISDVSEDMKSTRTIFDENTTTSPQSVLLFGMTRIAAVPVKIITHKRFTSPFCINHKPSIPRISNRTSEDNIVSWEQFHSSVKQVSDRYYYQIYTEKETCEIDNFRLDLGLEKTDKDQRAKEILRRAMSPVTFGRRRLELLNTSNNSSREFMLHQSPRLLSPQTLPKREKQGEIDPEKSQISLYGTVDLGTTRPSTERSQFKDTKEIVNYHVNRKNFIQKKAEGPLRKILKDPSFARAKAVCRKRGDQTKLKIKEVDLTSMKSQILNPDISQSDITN